MKRRSINPLDHSYKAFTFDYRDWRLFSTTLVTVNCSYCSPYY